MVKDDWKKLTPLPMHWQNFSGGIFLMWAEPDEGSYNYQIGWIRSRYDSQRKLKNETYLLEHIRTHADPFYPILVIEGFFFDGFLDSIALMKNAESNNMVLEHYGNWPRIVVDAVNDPAHVDSVKSFLKAVSEGHAF